MLDLEANIDYLSPFLLSAKDPNAVTKTEAQQIREACLKAYKDRLIERAQIMQTRGEQESTAYQQRQADYLKRQDTLTAEEVEAYKQFCNDTLFRIHILEKRLNKVRLILLILVFFVCEWFHSYFFLNAMIAQGSVAGAIYGAGPQDQAGPAAVAVPGRRAAAIAVVFQAICV